MNILAEKRSPAYSPRGNSVIAAPPGTGDGSLGGGPDNVYCIQKKEKRVRFFRADDEDHAHLFRVREIGGRGPFNRWKREAV